MSAAIPEGTAREFLQIERGLPRRGNGWRADGEPEARQDRFDPLGLGDRGNDRRSSSTFLTLQRTFRPLYSAPADLPRSPRGPARRSPQLPPQDPMARRHDPRLDGAARVVGAARPTDPTTAGTPSSLSRNFGPLCERKGPCGARRAPRGKHGFSEQRGKPGSSLCDRPDPDVSAARGRSRVGVQDPLRRSEHPPSVPRPTPVPRRALRRIKRPAPPSGWHRGRSPLFGLDVYRGRNY